MLWIKFALGCGSCKLSWRTNVPDQPHCVWPGCPLTKAWDCSGPLLGVKNVGHWDTEHISVTILAWRDRIGWEAMPVGVWKSGLLGQLFWSMGLVQSVVQSSAWSTGEVGFTLFFSWVGRTEFEALLFEEEKILKKKPWRAVGLLGEGPTMMHLLAGVWAFPWPCSSFYLCHPLWDLLCAEASNVSCSLDHI